jgi:sulfane dehydrogenase subunit SoxC
MHPKPPLTPPGVVRRIPLLPHEMVSRITPAADLFVLSHIGIPDIGSEKWTVAVDGMVARPRSFTLNDLREMPSKQIEAVHQCAGNPLAPHIPARSVANVVWRGVDLRDVFHECGIHEDATFIWSYGADHGDFAEIACDSYMKDLPFRRVAEGDVLLAYELNREPIPRFNGYPLRLVVPGFYATNSVKWLYRLTASDHRANSPFTTRFYNDRIADVRGSPRGRTQPVWDIAPESLIVAPTSGSVVVLGSSLRIWGWSWGSEPLAGVEVSTDGGRTWHSAQIERRGKWSWNRFFYDWTPSTPGRAAIVSRASDRIGIAQPAGGYRNAVHEVEVDVH